MDQCVMSMVYRVQVRCLIEETSYPFDIENRDNGEGCLCVKIDGCCCFNGVIRWKGALKGSLIVDPLGGVRYNGTLILKGAQGMVGIKFSRFGKTHVE
ncbi:MAG TPA: hypothetical protein QF353_06115 [Gammaproteobacteria bacterium]|nr:hypothetical protein [Gammaproteobacteria bacterium]